MGFLSDAFLGLKIFLNFFQKTLDTIFDFWYILHVEYTKRE